MQKTTKHPRPLYTALRAIGACTFRARDFRGKTFQQAWDSMTWPDFTWLVTHLPKSKAAYVHGIYDVISNMRVTNMILGMPGDVRYLSEAEKLALIKRQEVARVLRKALHAK